MRYEKWETLRNVASISRLGHSKKMKGRHIGGHTAVERPGFGYRHIDKKRPAAPRLAHELLGGRPPRGAVSRLDAGCGRICVFLVDRANADVAIWTFYETL